MTWGEVLSEVRSHSERFRGEGSIAWYRGHRCAAWELKSGAHRHVERLAALFPKRPPDSELLELFRGVSKQVYRRFKADAWSLLHDRERSDWAILFTMQHFGIPTRLLDWTESFACATFFAQHRRPRGEAAAIWILDPQAVNKTSLGLEGILSLDENSGEGTKVDPRAWHPRWDAARSLPTIAVAPIFSNPRMVAQQSAFTLSGDSFQSIDEQFDVLTKDRRIVKIVLEPELFDEVEEYLATAGLNAFSYYPDLEGLALKHEEQVERTIRDVKKFYPNRF